MKTDIERLLSGATMEPPCPPDELADFLVMVGQVPHQDYLDFISKHNGWDGPVGNHAYLSLWPVDEVISGTEDVNAAEFAPGLLLFGGDGGNEVFAFDRYDPRWPIVMVPLVGLSREDALPVAVTFTELIRRLAADDDLFARH